MQDPFVKIYNLDILRSKPQCLILSPCVSPPPAKYCKFLLVCCMCIRRVGSVWSHHLHGKKLGASKTITRQGPAYGCYACNDQATSLLFLFVMPQKKNETKQYEKSTKFNKNRQNVDQNKKNEKQSRQKLLDFFLILLICFGVRFFMYKKIAKDVTLLRNSQSPTNSQCPVVRRTA